MHAGAIAPSGFQPYRFVGPAPTPLSARPSPHQFCVRATDSSGTNTKCFSWTVVVNTTTTPPRVRIEGALIVPPDGSGNRIAFPNSRITTSEDLVFAFSVFPMGNGIVDRYCYTIVPGVSNGIGLNYNHCFPEALSTQRLDSIRTISGIPLGQNTFCVVVYQSSVRSTPDCFTFTRNNVVVQPPRAEIFSHWSLNTNPSLPPGTSRYEDIQDRGTTANTNVYFGFNAIPPTGVPWDPHRITLFYCRWDGQIAPSGADFNPCGVVPGFIVPSETFIPLQAFGLHLLNGVSPGHHELHVRAQYLDSLPGDESVFIWCVRDCTTISPEFRPIAPTLEAQRIPGGVMAPESSSAIAFAGINQTVSPKQPVILQGNIITFPPTKIFNTIASEYGKPSPNATLFNKTTLTNLIPVANVKSILWNQTAGPAVKLNSTNTQNVEFVSPIIDKDTLLRFNFMVTDDKGITSTDSVDVLVKMLKKQ